MNLAQLRYFVELAEYQNYTYTAKQLNITQPSLSNAIKGLEQELQVPLFRRVGRNAVLTEYGQVFADETRQVLERLDRAVERVQALSDTNQVVKLAALRSLNTQWLPKLVQQFLKGYPRNAKLANFRFASSSGFSPDIVQELLAGKHDLAFCAQTAAVPDLTWYPVVQQALVVIVPQDHELAQRKILSLAETMGDDHISFIKRSAAYQLVRDLNAQAGLAPNVVAYGENLQAVAGLVANHFGIAVVPYVDSLLDLPVTAIPLQGEGTTRTLYMAWRTDSRQSPLAQAFINFVKHRPRTQFMP